MLWGVLIRDDQRHLVADPFVIASVVFAAQIYILIVILHKTSEIRIFAWVNFNFETANRMQCMKTNHKLRKRQLLIITCIFFYEFIIKPVNKEAEYFKIKVHLRINCKGHCGLVALLNWFYVYCGAGRVCRCRLPEYVKVYYIHCFVSSIYNWL